MGLCLMPKYVEHLVLDALRWLKSFDSYFKDVNFKVFLKVSKYSRFKAPRHMNEVNSDLQGIQIKFTARLNNLYYIYEPKYELHIQIC